MGHHYIPQHYLRGFEVSDQPGTIWMYDRTAKKSKCLPIKVVAQEPGYYEEADETALADQIERPALRSLAALRRRQRLDNDDRRRLAIYIASLIVRVPRRRAKADAIYPDTLQETATRHREQWKQRADSSDSDSAVVALGLAEIERIERKFAAAVCSGRRRSLGTAGMWSTTTTPVLVAEHAKHRSEPLIDRTCIVQGNESPTVRPDATLLRGSFEISYAQCTFRLTTFSKRVGAGWPRRRQCLSDSLSARLPGFADRQVKFAAAGRARRPRRHISPLKTVSYDLVRLSKPQPSHPNPMSARPSVRLE